MADPSRSGRARNIRARVYAPARCNELQQRLLLLLLLLLLGTFVPIARGVFSPLSPFRACTRSESAAVRKVIFVPRVDGHPRGRLRKRGPAEETRAVGRYARVRIALRSLRNRYIR